MAFIYKILGQIQPTANTFSDVYAVPTSNSAIISTINVCNLGTGIATFRIAARPANATITGKNYIAYDAPLGINDMASMSMGLTLTATDVITVFANTSTVSFGIFGSEIN